MAGLFNAWMVVNIFTLLIILGLAANGDGNFSFVNPIVIYDNIRVNWFGAWLLAIVCNVGLPIIAIPYWIYKICTVNRD